MTRMTGPNCAVMCNLINTHTHTQTLRSNVGAKRRTKEISTIMYLFPSARGQPPISRTHVLWRPLWPTKNTGLAQLWPSLSSFHISPISSFDLNRCGHTCTLRPTQRTMAAKTLRLGFNASADQCLEDILGPADALAKKYSIAAMQAAFSSS